MAHLYDYLHDSVGIPRLIGGIPNRDVPGLFLMDIQLILSVAFGLYACFYIGKRISVEFKKSDKKQKCLKCDIEQGTVEADK